MKFLLTFILAFAAFSARSAIQIESSRVIYPGDSKSASLTIRNTSAKNYLVQSWLDGEDKGKEKSSLMVVTPPLLKLQPAQAATLRFIYSGQGLPEDRESMLWINVQEIPPRANQTNVMQLAIRTRLKLFYRPHCVTTTTEKEILKLKKQYVPGGVSFINSGPLHITLSSMKVKDKNGKLHDIVPSVVKPFSTDFIALPAGTTLTSISYINDYGGVIPFGAK
ncbi:MAG: molecular chaperone [Hafnia sp.]